MSNTRLSRGGIAVAIVQVGDIDWATSSKVLSASELKHAQKIQHIGSAQRFAIGRALLRKTLSWCTECVPTSFAFHVDQAGSPRLTENPWRLEFNVSHAADLVAVAISVDPVGIDVELVISDFDWLPVATQLLHASEADLLMASGKPDPATQFFRIWTRKEALLKATAVGMHLDLNLCSVLPDGAIRLPHSTFPWYLFDLHVHHRYAAALAAPRPKPDIMYLQVAQLP